jgi:hypothetical protein
MLGSYCLELRSCCLELAALLSRAAALLPRAAVLLQRPQSQDRLPWNSCLAHDHASPSYRHSLREQSRSLLGALRPRPVGAHHTPPRYVRWHLRQDAPRMARGSWRQVSVGRHVALGNAPHAAEDRLRTILHDGGMLTLPRYTPMPSGRRRWLMADGSGVAQAREPEQTQEPISSATMSRASR